MTEEATPVTDQPVAELEGRQGAATPSRVRGRLKAIDPARRITLLVLTVVLVLFAWHLVSDRGTPYTQFGKVDGYVVPIASQVSGYVSRVDVVLNEIVHEGDTLIEINPRPFQLAVNSARSQLELAGQQVRAGVSAVESAAGQLGVARARLDRAQRYYNRVETINEANPGALSQADRDRATTQFDQAVAGLESAEAELQRARETLGDENPAIKAAVAALEKAEFDLERTVILAPGLGVVGDLQLAQGHFASAGQPLATFISAQDVWVRADMRENNLGRIEIGAPAEIALDVAPGRIFRGHVASVSAGVNTGEQARGGLQTAETAQGWLQDPQRFPVIVRFDGDDSRGFRRVGGQANVVVYAGTNPVLNAVAWLRIRLTTVLSYVR
ncbi:HlyD family secretion protein [Gemmatimonadota bacterium]